MTIPTTGIASDNEPFLDLQRLVAGIRWRRRAWLSLALLGLIAGALLAVLVPTHTAAVRVLVVHEDDQVAVRESLMETDVALFQTTRIASAALEKINVVQRPEAFLRSYSGEGLTGNILQITVRGPSDRDAVVRAQALAETFIADHLQRTEDSANAESRALLERRARAEGDLEELNDQISSTALETGGANAADIGARLEALYARRAALANQIQEYAQRAEDSSIGAPRVAAGTQIVDPARATSGSRVMAVATNAAVGFVLGLGVGLALATVAGIVRDRPVLRRDIAAQLGASVIVQLPASRRRPRLWRRSSAAAERRRAAATLARLVRDAPDSVSLLEIGCARTAAEFALDIAGNLASEGPVVIGHLVADHRLRKPAAKKIAEKTVEIVDVAALPAGTSWLDPQRPCLGIGSVEPGTAWTDLASLGSETVLVVRAGHAPTEWLHTVARQLADQEIAVLGIVLVHPDPRDRTDGTLWAGLHFALRGRNVPLSPAEPTPVQPAFTAPVVPPTAPRPLPSAQQPAATNGQHVVPLPVRPEPPAVPQPVLAEPERIPTPSPSPSPRPSPSATPRPSARPRPHLVGAADPAPHVNGEAPAPDVDAMPTDTLPPVVPSTPVDPVEVS